MSNRARPSWTEGAAENAGSGPARGTNGTGQPAPKPAPPRPAGTPQGGAGPAFSGAQGAGGPVNGGSPNSSGTAGNGQPLYREPRPAPRSKPAPRPAQQPPARPAAGTPATPPKAVNPPNPSTPLRPEPAPPSVGQSGYMPPASPPGRPSAATVTEGAAERVARQSVASKDAEKVRPKAGDHTTAQSKATGPRARKAQLRVSRLDPWSVMKTSLLLAVAFGIVTWVAVFVVWSAIGAAGVFENINRTVSEVLGTPAAEPFRIEDYISTGKVMGFTTLIAVADVFIITALATLGSFLYNIAATLLGGLEVTLSSED